MALGSHGAALFTADGGQTWQDVSTGAAGYLGGVHFVDATRAWVVGEDGLVLTFSP